MEGLVGRDVCDELCVLGGRAREHRHVGRCGIGRRSRLEIGIYGSGCAGSYGIVRGPGSRDRGGRA